MLFDTSLCSIGKCVFLALWHYCKNSEPAESSVVFPCADIGVNKCAVTNGNIVSLARAPLNPENVSEWFSHEPWYGGYGVVFPCLDTLRNNSSM